MILETHRTSFGRFAQSRVGHPVRSDTGHRARYQDMRIPVPAIRSYPRESQDDAGEIRSRQWTHVPVSALRQVQSTVKSLLFRPSFSTVFPNCLFLAEIVEEGPKCKRCGPEAYILPVGGITVNEGNSPVFKSGVIRLDEFRPTLYVSIPFRSSPVRAALLAKVHR